MTKRKLTLSEKRELTKQKKAKSKASRETLPTEADLDSLLDHYQSGRYNEAEKIAMSVIARYPNHPFCWKILGALLLESGRLKEALTACQKAVKLSPKAEDAHNNLGSVFLRLGRFNLAEKSYRQALTLKPDLAVAHNNLGNVLKELRRVDEAEKSYRQAIRLKPDFAEAYFNLGLSLQAADQVEDAIELYKKALTLDPNDSDAHYNFGNALKELDRLEEAVGEYTHALALKPEFSQASYMLSSLTGDTPDTAPKIWVEQLFDQYADRFEDKKRSLEYYLPQIITNVILKNLAGGVLGSVLDLGCGTGLSGMPLKEHCLNIEGVDLSRSMLKKAEEKAVYSRLTCCDILEFLSSADLNFDYFICADVLIYIGDLSEVFRLIKSRNKTAGKFIFSTELTSKAKFYLEKTARYSHSEDYIKSLCEAFNYKLSHFEKINLRSERGQMIDGGLYVLDFD